MIDARVQTAAFDAGRQIERLGELKQQAVASFVGHLVAADDIADVFVDHHGPLARAELQAMAAEADGRWPLGGIILIHRHGRMNPGDRILFAGVSGTDIGPAQEACAFLVEAMRTRLPFWRKDLRADGTGDWR